MRATGPSPGALRQGRCRLLSESDKTAGGAGTVGAWSRSGRVRGPYTTARLGTGAATGRRRACDSAREIPLTSSERIGARLPDLMPDSEAFEANRASTEAEHPRLRADPRTRRRSRHREPRGGDARLRPGGSPARRPAHHADPQLPARARRRLGTTRADDRQRASGDELIVATELCSAWMFAYVDAALCLAEDFYSADGSAGFAAPPRPEPRRSTRSSPARQSTGGRQPAARIRARPPAHRRGRVAAGTRRGTRHATPRWKPRSATPRAPWRHARAPASTRDPLHGRLDHHCRSARCPPARRPAIRHAHGARGPGRDRRTSPRDRRLSPKPHRGSRSPPRRRARPPPPGTITRYARVALSALATSDLDQARTFVQRELQGLAGDDDSTARLTATYEPTSTSTPAAAVPPNASGSTRTRSATGSSKSEEVLGRSVDQRTLELRVALALSNLVRDRSD